MQQRASLAHTRWDCKYHVVFVPKYRRKALYGVVRREVGRVLRRLCEQRGIELIEGHAMPDHVHLCLSIPPKFAVSEAIGFLKGKSAIWLSNEVAAERRRLEKDLAAAEKEVVATAAKLGNEAFLSKAPEAVVGKIRARQQLARDEVDRITVRLSALA